MLLRKVNGDVLPFAGITLTRFYGFDLRTPVMLSLSKQADGHPGKLKTKPLKSKAKN